MSQNNPVIGSGLSGLEYRNQDNDAKRALLSNHKGSTPPSYAEAGCLWLDDSATPWVLKFFDGADWLKLAEINAATNNVQNINHAADIAGKATATPALGDFLLLSDISDSGNLKKGDISGIISVGAALALEYSKAQNFDATVLTDAATIEWNLENNQVASITLGGNRTLGAPSNMKDGATYILRIKQDATSGRTLAYNAAFKFPGGVVPVLSTIANAVDILTFVSDGTYMYGVAQKGFA